MSNCSINTKKFKQFSLYNLSNGTLITSNAPEYNHILQDSNKVFLVGYKFINATQCPEVKLRLEDVLAASNISLGFNLTDNNELQYTTEYNSQDHINWVNTGIVIPQPSTGCTCEIALSFDRNSGKIYYTLQGTDGLSAPDCKYISIPISSESASDFTSTVNYDADNEPYAEFDSDGVFNIHLLQQPTISGIAGLGNLTLTSNNGDWDNTSGATNTYTLYDDQSQSLGTISVKNGVDGDSITNLTLTSNELFYTIGTGSSISAGSITVPTPEGVASLVCVDANGNTIEPSTGAGITNHYRLLGSNGTNFGDFYVSNGTNGQGSGGSTPSGTYLVSFAGPTTVNTTSGGSNTYTVTDSDNNQTQFTVMNGTNGTNGVSPIVSIDDNVSGQHIVTITDADGSQSFIVHDGINGTNGNNGQNGADGTKIELYRCTVTVDSSLVQPISIPQADSQTSLPVQGGTASSLEYYNLPGNQTWEKYNATSHIYTSTTAPVFESGDVVEVCPSDYSAHETALNLLYGTFGKYQFSNNINNGSIIFYSIKDPTVGKYAFRFVVKVYKNMQ